MRTAPLVLLNGLLFLATPVIALQTGAASLMGIVTDQSGAAVPGANGDHHQPGHQRGLHRRVH